MRTVVVTGVGVYIPGCANPEMLFSTLQEKTSFIKYDERIAALGIDGIATCSVSDDEISTLDYLYPNIANEVNTSGKMAFHALKTALNEAQVDIAALGRRCGLFYGVHKHLMSPQLLHKLWNQYDPKSQNIMPNEQGINELQSWYKPDQVMKSISRELGFSGPAFAYADACAAGTTNIIAGMRRIRSGHLDVALCGASDQGSQPLWNLVFKHIGALNMNEYNSAEEVCRPFDKDRAGTVLGDGAGFLVLEELEHAKARGANILAYISGGSRDSESNKITSSDPDGSFYFSVMEQALADAGLDASDIDFINAHGTATKSNDIAEGRAINQLFGNEIPVSSTKSALGHSLSGSGAVEAVLSVLMLNKGILLPTLNYQAASAEEEQINIVTEPVKSPIQHVLSNSFGFGGQNASLIISAKC